MTVTADQVGKLYDILIATRDGSTLACVDHLGHTQQISQVAYMLSTTKASSEATEIQRRDQLVQLSSAQMIDRDFEAYPQIEQGNWSDGVGQRVFSGQGEALGTVSNKSTAYWDGLGVLWPIDDYLPQQAVLADPDQGGGVIRKQAEPGLGTIAGQINLFAPGLNIFAYCYMQQAAPNNHILVLQGPSSQSTLTNPPGLTAGVQNAAGTVDFLFAYGRLWWAIDNAGVATVYGWDGVTFALGETITGAQFPASTGAPNPPSTLAAGIVGGRSYLAAAHVGNASGNGLFVRLYDLTAVTGVGSIATGAADIPFLATAALMQSAITIQQVEFFGNSIVVAIGDLTTSTYLIQYDISSQTYSTLAVFRNTTDLYVCSIAGGLFVLATNNQSAGGQPAQADMYLIQGGQLQHIGPLTVQGTAATANFMTAFSSPQAFGPYAVWSVVYKPVGLSTSRVATFAYDALRGRRFRLADIGPYSGSLGNTYGRRQAVLGPMLHPRSGQTLTAAWGVAPSTLSNAGDVNDVTNTQRLLWNVSNGSFQPLLQQGVQITSSLIDFTSGQNKLYRQLVADFTALPNDAAITVQLDCWFDQDPSNLAAVPDFTTGAVAGGGANVGLKQLKLVTNRIARKVVYRITTTGPSMTLTPAVKVISVKVQVATGWALHYFLDIARNVLCNDMGTYCFDNQRPVDDFSAHAFLKQLWRLKGGECVVTLPTGETYNALMQLVSAENVKHVIQSSLSDTPVVKSVLVELKIREDV